MIGVLLVLGLVFLYVISTMVNQSTDIPKECRDLPVEKCSSCQNHSCSFKESV